MSQLVATYNRCINALSYAFVVLGVESVLDLLHVASLVGSLLQVTSAHVVTELHLSRGGSALAAADVLAQVEHVRLLLHKYLF